MEREVLEQPLREYGNQEKMNRCLRSSQGPPEIREHEFAVNPLCRQPGNGSGQNVGL